MLDNGYFRVGRLVGVELRLHWSVPVGALVFGSLRFEPVLWLAFMAVIFVHELGHAALVKSLGFRVVAIDLTGFGGQCRWRGSANSLEHAWVAWGGVLAQTGLLMSTLLVVALFGAPESGWGVLVSYGFININLWIIAMNLLPFPPLDGARAWNLFRELKLAGWTPRQALFRPLKRWAERRRQARQGKPGAGVNVAGPTAEPRGPQERASDGAAAQSEDEVLAPSDGQPSKPSAQAQRELAALLERIADEAGKAKRRR
jgi:Zn-dependent protease